MDDAVNLHSRVVRIAGRDRLAKVLTAPVPGKGQDRWTAADGILAVADGATPLHRGSMDPGALAETVLASLAEARAHSARGRLAVAVESATREAEVGDASAGLAAVLDAPAGPAAVVLGDCEVHVVMPDRVLPVVSRRLSALDAKVLGRLREALRSGDSLVAARARVREELLANREMRNRPGGYWIVGAGERVESHAVIRRLPVPVEGFVIASDGFARLWNVFGIAAPRDLVRCEDPDLRSLLHELRRLERAQAGSPHVAQFSDYDDATAIVVRSI